MSAVNRRDLYVLVGKTEMYLPAKERIPTEEFSVGDSIRAIVHNVKQEANGPAVTLSRASAEFVRTLFRLEVSEISDGVVELISVARDPGYRSKIAVRTNDEKVDPVGACVGLRGGTNHLRDRCAHKDARAVDAQIAGQLVAQYVAVAVGNVGKLAFHQGGMHGLDERLGGSHGVYRMAEIHPGHFGA